MELAKVEQYVSCLLESWALYDSGEERVVWQTLHDLLMAVSRFELMTDHYKEMTTQLCKKLQHHFDTRFILKERKRKAKKEKFPPNPLLKEKQTKEKEEKNPPTVCDAEQDAFRKECLEYVGKYDQQQVANFYHYWTERDETGRMRFQNQRYFNVGTRLGRWVKNQYTANDTAAAERIKKSRSRQDKQQAVAQERNEANDRLWQQYADMKKGAVSHEEYLRMKEKEHESHE